MRKGEDYGGTPYEGGLSVSESGERAFFCFLLLATGDYGRMFEFEFELRRMSFFRAQLDINRGFIA